MVRTLRRPRRRPSPLPLSNLRLQSTEKHRRDSTSRDPPASNERSVSRLTRRSLRWPGERSARNRRCAGCSESATSRPRSRRGDPRGGGAPDGTGRESVPWNEPSTRPACLDVLPTHNAAHNQWQERRHSCRLAKTLELLVGRTQSRPLAAHGGRWRVTESMLHPRAKEWRLVSLPATSVHCARPARPSGQQISDRAPGQGNGKLHFSGVYSRRSFTNGISRPVSPRGFPVEHDAYREPRRPGRFRVPR